MTKRKFPKTLLRYDLGSGDSENWDFAETPADVGARLDNGKVLVGIYRLERMAYVVTRVTLEERTTPKAKASVSSTTNGSLDLAKGFWDMKTRKLRRKKPLGRKQKGS